MDEKMRILKMVEEGKLSAEEAISLIDALGESVREDETAGQYPAYDNGCAVVPKGQGTSYENKMLRIVVDSTKGDKVNVQLPVKIIRQVLKVTGKLPIQSQELQGIDLDTLTASIIECLDSETLGNIIDVSASDGTTVKIFIG